ncbi:unnamed protein product [Thlaspi arvense]|uniref:BHLH domain-containing protein n=1 Tax=Thlaspi arvense TaxID=13288 RepID=A0AAU9SCW5_THLAR|nr:unnamed protein product [Thlaspi arvense]
MDLTGEFGARSGGGGMCRESTGLESLHLGDEFRPLVTLPPENAGGFTALLELPPTQAVELLHFTDSSSSQAAVTGIGGDIAPPLHSFGTLTFPSNPVLMERAARFSVIATEQQNGNVSGETTTSSSANPDRVKTEPADADSSQRLVSDQAAENQSPCPSQNNRSGKRKEFEKKARREKINARMKLLQELVPGCDKIQGTALVLDEIINHVQSLQRQVEMLSMRLAAVNPRIDFNLDTILASENGSLMDGSFNGTSMQLAWPHQVMETEQSYHHRQLQPPPPQQWTFDGLNQPVWEREEDQAHGNDHNSLMASSENLMVGSENLHPNQVKMEL